ncbi:MAG: gamma carbonic anhydrase family protein [Desulfitobacteriaceae bacterium]
MLLTIQSKEPKIGRDVFLAEGCKVIGDVTLADQASIWFNAVVRGDLAPISIGKCTNIQDLSMIHVNENQPVLIEEDVTVGHNVILHGCTIRRGSLIGMGTIILNGSEIGEETIVAAGSLIPERKTFPSRVLLMGSPAKVVRELTVEDLRMIRGATARYLQKAQDYLKESHQAALEIVSGKCLTS